MEDKIEIGEYVKFKDGNIDKIKDIRDTYGERKLIAFEKRNTYLSDFGLEKNIIKHSKNIKELIEAEDCLIYKLKGSDWVRKGFVRKHIDARTNKEYLSVEFYSLDQLEILQIVTKEQFDSVVYTV